PERAAAGAGDRRAGVAGAVAGAGRGAGAVDPAVARGAARRAVLAAGVAAAGLRADRLPGHAGRRLGRRVPQRHLPGAGAAGGPGPAAVRPLEPHGHRPLPARPPDRPGAGDGPLVGPLAARPPQRGRRGPAGDRVRPPPDPARRPPRRAPRGGAGGARGPDALGLRPGGGSTAWISCAGHLPFGQPGDQRSDDAWSLTYDWELADELEVLGHPRLAGRGAAAAAGGRLARAAPAPPPGAFLSPKLWDFSPAGPSPLGPRGFLTLPRRGPLPGPEP